MLGPEDYFLIAIVYLGLGAFAVMEKNGHRREQFSPKSCLVCLFWPVIAIWRVIELLWSRK
jgi:hypothetical protein